MAMIGPPGMVRATYTELRQCLRNKKLRGLQEDVAAQCASRDTRTNVHTVAHNAVRNEIAAMLRAVGLRATSEDSLDLPGHERDGAMDIEYECGGRLYWVDVSLSRRAERTARTKSEHYAAATSGGRRPSRFYRLVATTVGLDTTVTDIEAFTRDVAALVTPRERRMEVTMLLRDFVKRIFTEGAELKTAMERSAARPALPPRRQLPPALEDTARRPGRPSPAPPSEPEEIRVRTPQTQVRVVRGRGGVPVPAPEPDPEPEVASQLSQSLSTQPETQYFSIDSQPPASQAWEAPKSPARH